MKNLLSKYSDEVSEKFNENLIYGKATVDIEKEATQIFKSLETIPGITVNEVKLYTNEEAIKPIMQQDAMYKQVTDSRFNRLHYSITIDGYQYPIENDINMLKIVDNFYFINDDVRYFPIWQLTPVFSYHTHNGISLKTLSLPLTIIKNKEFIAYPEFGRKALEHIPDYTALIFNKAVPPIYYFMSKYAMESLEKCGTTIYEDSSYFESYTDKKVIDEFCKLVGIKLRFSDDPNELKEDGHYVFKLNDGVAFSISDKDAKSNTGKFVLSMLLNSTTKKGDKLTFKYKDVITPWFWVNELAKYFVKGTDCIKRYTKVCGIFVSLSKVIDDITRETMPIPKESKKDVFSLITYVVDNYSDLVQRSNTDLRYMKLSLYEFILYPLRIYINRKIIQLTNQQTITVDDKKKIFNKLTHMFLIKALVNEEKSLMRVYNLTSEMSLFGSALTATLSSPQSISTNIPVKSRDINESYVGRVSLVRASPSNPGLIVTLSPQAKVYGKPKFFVDYKVE